MRFAPLRPLPGVVYPDPADVARWHAAGALTGETLADGFRTAAARHAERDALLWLDGRQSYAALDARSDRVALGLLELGLEPLDRVVFQLTNAPETLLMYLACWKASLVPLCTLAAHREAEIGYLARFAGARAHLIESDTPKFDFHGFAARMRDEVDSLEFVVSTRGTPGIGAVGLDALDVERDADETRERLAAVAPDPWQVAAFQLSGGTTGVPKIIPRLHSEYLYNMRSVARFKGWTSDDRMLVPMPFTHNLNMACGWGPTLMTGGAVIATPSIDAAAIRETHRACRPTIMGAAKPIVMRMKDEIAAGRLEVGALREIYSTDAAETVTSHVGVPGHQLFGMTEGTIMFTREGDSETVRFTTCGTPVSELDEVRLLVPGTEDEAAPGDIGELAVRGPYTIRGYYDAEERNAVAFTSDGFYRSGDLMRRHRLDGHDRYSFEGRLKDVVDRAGEKVNCEEVERAVMAHPAFSDVALVGMPCPTHGERLCLFAVPAPDRELPSVAELGEFLKGAGLAIFKWPERIEPVDALPLTKVGKLDKAPLRTSIAETLRREVGAGDGVAPDTVSRSAPEKAGA